MEMTATQQLAQAVAKQSPDSLIYILKEMETMFGHYGSVSSSIKAVNEMLESWYEENKDTKFHDTNKKSNMIFEATRLTAFLASTAEILARLKQDNPELKETLLND